MLSITLQWVMLAVAGGAIAGDVAPAPGFNAPGRSRPELEGTAHRLQEAGLDGVRSARCDAGPEELRGAIYFENRGRRDPAGLAAAALDLCADDRISLLPMANGVVLASVSTDSGSAAPIVRYESADGLGCVPIRVADASPSTPRSLRGQVDLELAPHLEASFGLVEDPQRWAAGIGVSATVYASRGVRVVGKGVWTPLDELERDLPPLRPVVVAAELTRRGPVGRFGPTLWRLGAGMTEEDRWGALLDAVWVHRRGLGWLGLSASSTGHLSLDRRYRWRYSPLEKPRLIGELAWWYGALDIELKVEGGTYLAGDRGGGVTFSRSWGESTLRAGIRGTDRQQVIRFAAELPLPWGGCLAEVGSRSVFQDAFPCVIVPTRGYGHAGRGSHPISPRPSGHCALDRSPPVSGTTHSQGDRHGP